MKLIKLNTYQQPTPKEPAFLSPLAGKRTTDQEVLSDL
jgi:hypothetical protein